MCAIIGWTYIFEKSKKFLSFFHHFYRSFDSQTGRNGRLQSIKFASEFGNWSIWFRFMFVVSIASLIVHAHKNTSHTLFSFGRKTAKLRHDGRKEFERTKSDEMFEKYFQVWKQDKKKRCRKWMIDIWRSSEDFEPRAWPFILILEREELRKPEKNFFCHIVLEGAALLCVLKLLVT